MLRLIRSAVLYTALAIGANTATADTAALDALRDGSMKKLSFLSEAKPLPDTALLDMSGGLHSLEEFQGKYVVLNFWATWCAPCRKEMPDLDALQAEFGGDRFDVVTVAAGHNPPPAITKFFEKTGVENVVVLRDPKQELAAKLGIFGLPTTLILNPEGQEIARMRGDAEWYGDSARAIIAALLTGG